MIRTEKIAKRFGMIRALDGLSLHVEQGAIYGFLGPNGAGKTTTLRILSGLARADQGQAWIMGQRVGLRALGQRPMLGVLPEEPAFYPWMTAREYLRDFIAPLYRMSRTEAIRRTAELLETVGLSEAADRRLGGFSRGMRQRIGLAQALIHRPQILLLDEPVSALDPAGRKEVLDLIESLHGQTTVLLSTHILADVERVCDMIGIIRKGRMVIEARREDLLQRFALPIFEVEADNGFGEWPERVRQMPFVEKVSLSGRNARVFVAATLLDMATAKRELLVSITDQGLLIRRFEMVMPSLEDVFLRLTDETSAEK